MLFKMGLPAFVAKVLTLDPGSIESGIDQMCSKTEIQFQCQLGFGESRYVKCWLDCSRDRLPISFIKLTILSSSNPS